MAAVAMPSHRSVRSSGADYGRPATGDVVVATRTGPDAGAYDDRAYRSPASVLAAIAAAGGVALVSPVSLL